MSANTGEGREGAVLLIDVAGSSSLLKFRQGRDRKIRELSKRHRASRWTALDYAVTAWDEFQSVSWQFEQLPHILLDIRQIFAPWEVYVAVGCGRIAGWRSKRPVNEALSGEGFERARVAMNELKAGRGDKYRKLSRFRSEDKHRDQLLNLIYGLHDSLVQQVTDRQWETIRATFELANQEDVAARLGVQPSTVTRNLKRGHYWQMRETASLASALLAQDAAGR
ncbi:MAG: hypothetical protein WD448_02335 [Woeseia sp.]